MGAQEEELQRVVCGLRGSGRRYDGEGRPPVTDGPFAETEDLIAGWMVIDVDTFERALLSSRAAKSFMYCTWSSISCGVHWSIGTLLTASGAPR